MDGQNQPPDQGPSCLKLSCLGCVATLVLLMGMYVFLAGATFAVVQGVGNFITNPFGLGQNNTSGGNGASASDCANAAIVPSQYRPWVQDAARKYLHGDEAALIALIKIESGWNSKSVNPTGIATGLGQFLPSTARGYPEFVGGDDRHGTIWPAGMVYDRSTGHPDDARFDPKRSIYAAAHLFGPLVDRYGSVGDAYDKGYHGGAKLGGKYAVEAAQGRARLEKAYAQLRSGDCDTTGKKTTLWLDPIRKSMINMRTTTVA